MTTESSPRAAIFDFGGVMTQPLSSISTPAGVEPKVGTFASIFHPTDRQAPWARLERGEIPIETFALEVGSQFPDLAARFNHEAMLKAIGGLQINPHMVALVAELRSMGVVTGLCTNNISEARPIWSEKLDLDALFDFVVDSSAVGTRKPEPGIYSLVEQRSGLPASESIFVDDFHENIVAAQMAGFHAVYVDHVADHIADIREIFGIS